MAAILVDFKLRPYLKFSKSNFIDSNNDETKEPPYRKINYKY